MTESLIETMDPQLANANIESAATTMPPIGLADPADFEMPDRTASVPLSPKKEEGGEPADEGEVEEFAPNSKTGKLFQREQRERARMQRELSGQIAEVKDMLKGLAQAKPLTPAQRDELDDIEDAISGERAKDVDAVVPGLPATIKALVSRIRKIEAGSGNGSSKAEKAVEELRTQLGQAQFDAFWSRYPADFRQRFEERQEALSDKGIHGAELQGRMDEWFDTELAKNSRTAKTETEKETQPNAASGAGARRSIVPVTTAPRKAAPVNLKEVLQSGKGGNIAGIPFKRGR